jgi:hypothetical protein
MKIDRESHIDIILKKIISISPVQSLMKIFSFIRLSGADKERLLKFKHVMERPLGNCSKGNVLVFGVVGLDLITQQSVVIKSYDKAGYNPVIICDWRSMAIYKALGVRDFINLNRYLPISRVKMASSIIHSFSCQDELKEYFYGKINCGKYTLSTVMRKTRKGHISFNNNENIDKMITCLDRSLRNATAALKVLKVVSPKALLCLDRGYSPEGEFFDACIEQGIPCLTWNAAHKDNTLMLKRYTSKNSDSHPSTISQSSWDKIKKIKWKKEDRDFVLKEIQDCYTSGQWYGEVGTQFGRKFHKKSELIKKMSLDPNKKTAIIFSHIFWDATFFWGSDIFKDYEDWFVETIKAAMKNKNLNWVIKVHPANEIKNKRDKHTGESSEMKAIKKVMENIPEHIQILEEKSNISTNSLFSVMDYCLTVRGTIGIESALHGKVVITAGTGRYNGMGFTNDYSNSADYLTALSRIHTMPTMSNKSLELAEKYTYAVFLCRPTQLQTVKARFIQNEFATLAVDLCVDSHEALATMPDINRVTDFLLSDKEDFFLCPKSA